MVVSLSVQAGPPNSPQKSNKREHEHTLFVEKSDFSLGDTPGTPSRTTTHCHVTHPAIMPSGKDTEKTLTVCTCYNVQDSPQKETKR